MTDTPDSTKSNVVELPKKKRGRFADPNVPNPGRPVGAYNRYTRVLKEALIIAAELEGSNGKGAGKLIGFMRHVAQDDLRAFCMLLGRAMPLQVENKVTEVKEQVVYQSMEEVQREMASRGISLEVMFKLMKAEPEPMNDEDTIDGETLEDDANG